jgi:hypothetical protein
MLAALAVLVCIGATALVLDGREISGLPAGSLKAPDVFHVFIYGVLATTIGANALAMTRPRR